MIASLTNWSEVVAFQTILCVALLASEVVSIKCLGACLPITPPPRFSAALIGANPVSGPLWLEAPLTDNACCHCASPHRVIPHYSVIMWYLSRVLGQHNS